MPTPMSKSNRPLRFSVLDLAPIVRGGTARQSFANSRELAQRAEQLGYHRYWFAEHHNIPGVASAATSVLIGHIAEATRSMRVGSGGIMLPNHAPLVIAEQFGTLAELYPGRIDLGLGRAPGGDMATTMALRRDAARSGDSFPDDVRELQRYFGDAGPGPGEPDQVVHAIPGQGLEVPLYLLGSSLFSASLAAELGLPFAFASHFAPDLLHQALAIYRSNFRPSTVLGQPYVIVAANVFAADTDEEAARLFTTLQQMFVGMIRRQRGELPPPVDTMQGLWTPAEEAHVRHMTRVSLVGNVATIKEQLQDLIEATQPDEIIATAQMFDHAARMHSLEMAADVFAKVSEAAMVGA